MDPAEVQRRVQRFQDTGFDPRALWDDVTATQFGDAMREIARVAGPLLASPSASGARIADPVPGGAAAFGAAAHASGMGALLGRWIEDGRLDASPAIIARLAEHLLHGRRRADRLRGALRSLLGALRREGIRPIVLKGLHTGAVFFPEPGTRPCADIDLLVSADEAVTVRRLLADGGLRASLEMAERATWADPRNDVLVSLDLPHEDNPWSIDLHVSLDRRFRGARGRTSLGPLGERDLVRWDLDGEPAFALAPDVLLAHLALHASDHLPRLSMVRLAELALVARQAREVDWGAFCHRFARSGALPFFHPSIALAERLVPGSVDAALLERLWVAAPERVRRFAERLEPATALDLFGGDTLEGRFVWSGSWLNDLRQLFSLLWPRGLDGRRLSSRAMLEVTRLRWRRWRAGRLHLRDR